MKYKCEECYYVSTKWLGKCPNCQQWNTFEEEGIELKKYNKVSSTISTIQLTDIEYNKEFRIKTKYQEFDTVLGGGLIKGSVTLITGNPGIGKSTMLLQISNEYANKYSVYYVSGEESPKQIKERANRLKINNNNIVLVNAESIEKILNLLNEKTPQVVIIDSIQTMFSEEISSIPGNVTQIRECCFKIIEFAKNNDISFFIVGHVTKDGKLAGPKLLEHMVDTYLQIEGDENNYFRVLRSIKNRFGTTNEIAIFDMQDSGMKEIKNPSEFFLSQREEKSIGSLVVSSIEGSKVILYEVQTLISKNNYGFAKRIIQGYDKQRIEILIAILSKYLDVDLTTKDIYVNIPGGIEIKDRSGDLAIVLSLISSYKNKEISQKIAAIGELGLRGEVRKISFIKKRIKELEKLGFSGVYLPDEHKEDLKNQNFNIKLNYIKNIGDLLERIN